MRRTTSPKISKETISTYAAHSENGQFIIDYLSSLIVYEYDDTLLWKSSFQRFDESGSLAESALTKRKAHPKGYIYERYNHNGELDGYIICDKNGTELESTLLGQHSSTYDKDGKLTSHKSVYMHNDTHEHIFTYDDSGKLLQTTEIVNGKARVLNHFYSEDGLGNVVETSLDTEGNLVRTEVISKATGHTLETKEISETDPLSYDITYYRNNLNDSFHARVTNNKIKHNTYRTLEYDEYDNWILELTSNNILGEPQYYIRVRDIIYNDQEDFGEFKDF